VTRNGPQLTVHEPIEIAIASYPGAQATCVHGLGDLFTYADYFARMHAAGSTHGTPLPAGAGERPFIRVTQLEWSEDRPPPERTFAVVILPACQLGPPQPAGLPKLGAWVARRHAEGAIVAAVCGGVFVLADSGLLDGRRVTTHWMFAAELQRRHAALRVEPERLVIDDSDIVTAGGVLAWTDLGLTLVARLLGRTVMCSTARFMLMDPPGREQRYYGEFAPPLLHGDKTILTIQHRLQARSAVADSVSALAERAGLSTRTFLRRFVKATGMKPSEYQQRVRIARSRELLEFTRDTVAQVAIAAGYEDTRGFRRTFKRVIGLSPAEYRRRFGRMAGSVDAAKLPGLQSPA
jgi:transcriptional regulator GlxA family with amidase domain